METNKDVNKMKKFYNKVKSFIENFDNLKDYNKISIQLEEICTDILKCKNINKQIKIEFEDNKALGNCATEYPDKISFNKLRCDTIMSLQLDCTDNNHLEKIYNFYNNYDEKGNHSKFEICLYNFMKKYIGFGLQDYFSQMGSHKTIKYELLETLFHEVQHVVQEDFNERYMKNNKSINLEDLILIFTMLFNNIHRSLLENNIQFDYVRENYSFPIEFDARYVALIMVENLRQKYFMNDKYFIKSILNNDILPQNVSFKELAEKIYEDFENIYNIYNINFESNYDAIISIVNKHKDEILSQLVNRYEEMNKIYNNLKIELNKNK